MSFQTAPFVGLGQEFQFGGVTSPPLPTTSLLHLLDVVYSGSKVDVADTTDCSAYLGFRSWIPGLQEAGEVTIKCIWYPGDVSQEALTALKGSSGDFLHTLPNGLGTIAFAGLVISADHTAPMDKAGEVTYKIKISSSSTYTT